MICCHNLQYISDIKTTLSKNNKNSIKSKRNVCFRSLFSFQIALRKRNKLKSFKVLQDSQMKYEIVFVKATPNLHGGPSGKKKIRRCTNFKGTPHKLYINRKVVIKFVLFWLLLSTKPKQPFKRFHRTYLKLI